MSNTISNFLYSFVGTFGGYLTAALVSDNYAIGLVDIMVLFTIGTVTFALLEWLDWESE